MVEYSAAMTHFLGHGSSCPRHIRHKGLARFLSEVMVGTTLRSATRRYGPGHNLSRKEHREVLPARMFHLVMLYDLTQSSKRAMQGPRYVTPVTCATPCVCRDQSSRVDSQYM